MTSPSTAAGRALPRDLRGWDLAGADLTASDLGGRVLVRADMEERVGDQAYTVGYRVHTTVRSHLQRAAGHFRWSLTLPATNTDPSFEPPEALSIGPSAH